MKKMLLGAVGLSAVLASCGGVDVVGPVVSPTLALTEVTAFEAQYRTASNLNDESGNQIATAGDYVICRNRTNDVRVQFDWSGDLASAAIRLKGFTTGNITTSVTFDYPTDFETDGSIIATLAQGAAPLSLGKSLSPQGIVVTPVNVVKLYGRSYLEMQIYDSFGRVGTVPNGADGGITFQSATALPVVDCQ